MRSMRDIRPSRRAQSQVSTAVREAVTRLVRARGIGAAARRLRSSVEVLHAVMDPHGMVGAAAAARIEEAVAGLSEDDYLHRVLRIRLPD